MARRISGPIITLAFLILILMTGCSSRSAVESDFIRLKLCLDCGRSDSAPSET